LRREAREIGEARPAELRDAALGIETVAGAIVVDAGSAGAGGGTGVAAAVIVLVTTFDSTW
jgi:hypothetical protein